MDVLMRLVEVLELKLKKEIKLHEIGVETISLMLDEIDTEMVPISIVTKLVEPIVCDCANYTDDEGNYYTLISVETMHVKPYEVWLINDKVVPHFLEGVEDN